MRGLLSPTAFTLGLICALICCDPARAEKRVALVIGNSAYQHVPALPNPARDARAIAGMFEKAGFDVVTTQYDAGNLQLKRAIRQFEDAAADADVAVIYYAGHGIQIHGANYLVPVDAKLAADRDADEEAITFDRLVEATDGARRLRLVILDACRDNAFTRTMKRERVVASPEIHAGLCKVEPTGVNTLIAFAAKTGISLDAGDDDHSPYAAALLANLFVPGLDVRLALGRVRDEVLKKTNNRQEPFVYGSLGDAAISLVSMPEQQPVPAASEGEPRQQPAATASEGEKADYELVEKIGTKGAWQVFLAQHPKGFYADLARQQLSKLASAHGGGGTTIRSPPAPREQQVASVEPTKPPKVLGPSREEQRQWDKIKNSGNAELFREFIRRYPASPLANIAQSHVEAIELASRERERLAAEREEKARLAAQRKEEARRQEKQEVALKRARDEAKAAEAARAKAEREAARRREEAARAKQAAEPEAKRLKTEQAEREAALNRAREEAKAAEAARAKAEREAALKRDEEERQRKAADAEHAKQETCRREEERFSALQAQGGKVVDELKQLEQELTCARLRPLVIAALKQAIAEREKSSLPEFPWPPPAASSSYVLPKQLFKNRETIGQLTDSIISALESSGYVERSFFKTRHDGTALVTRLERIHDDGSPWAGHERWPTHGAKYDTGADLLSFLRGLFYADPGRYRVIVFIIQDMPFFQSKDKVTGEAARTWLRSGANKLPRETAARPLSSADCTALVYEFASDGTAVRFVESRLTGKQHLERAGVMAFLQKAN
jgi:Caspase domain